jgi:four helix bundle protein
MENRLSDKKFDLEERTALFAENLLNFLKNLPETTKNKSIIIQLIRSGTSIGANYMEATGAESKKDFRHKIGICKKESRETRYWLRLLLMLCFEKKDDVEKLSRESYELLLIFSKIFRSCSSK